MTYTSFRTNIVQKRKNGIKWQDIMKDYPGVSIGTLCRIAHDPAYRPRSRSLRQALGLCGKRRKYDLTNREAREIGIDILRRLYGGKDEKES